MAVKFLAVPLPKPPCNGRFTSDTVTWIQKWFKKSVGTSRNSYTSQILKAEAMGVGVETARF
jgi:hypothetical protein